MTKYVSIYRLWPYTTDFKSSNSLEILNSSLSKNYFKDIKCFSYKNKIIIINMI